MSVALFRKGTKSMGRRIINHLLTLAILVGLAAAVFSDTGCIRKSRNTGKGQASLEGICAVMETAEAAEPVEQEENGDGADAEAAELLRQREEKKRLAGYAELHEQNSDMVGWIQIEGTKVDYPVMQTPEEPEYHLRL